MTLLSQALSVLFLSLASLSSEQADIGTKVIEKVNLCLKAVKADSVNVAVLTDAGLKQEVVEKTIKGTEVTRYRIPTEKQWVTIYKEERLSGKVDAACLITVFDEIPGQDGPLVEKAFDEFVSKYGKPMCPGCVWIVGEHTLALNNKGGGSLFEPPSTEISIMPRAPKSEQ